MRCVPPFVLMDKWLAVCAVPGTTLVRPPYDDVLDVLRAMIALVPVDEDWYNANYPAVAAAVPHRYGETATTHLRKHGYFEGRQPFSEGRQDLRRPIAFAELKTHFRMIVRRGRLFAQIEREDLLELVRKLLTSISVDEAWYRATYPVADEDIRYGRSPSAAAHYLANGYFEGALPADVAVDEDWYVARYAHVRNGLALGVATSAKDHFLRIGYSEGCQPAPP